jgi:hypothetical protein
MSIGRSRECDVTIEHETLSRKHATIHVRWDGADVEDNGSRNGTFVNGERVRGRMAIHEGDVVVLGTVRFYVEAAPLDQTAPLAAAPPRRDPDTLKDDDPTTNTTAFALMAALADIAFSEQRPDEAEKHALRFLDEVRSDPEQAAAEAPTVRVVLRCVAQLARLTKDPRWVAISDEIQTLTRVAPDPADAQLLAQLRR